MKSKPFKTYTDIEFLADMKSADNLEVIFSPDILFISSQYSVSLLLETSVEYSLSQELINLRGVRKLF